VINFSRTVITNLKSSDTVAAAVAVLTSCYHGNRCVSKAVR